MRQRLRAVRAQRGNDGGFTLTELLIVIVILGVLTGIVVFAVGAFTNRGEVSACRTAMKTVETAIETYRAQNSGALPPDMAALVPTYLRTNPSSDEYTIVVDFGTGAVSGHLGVGATGTDCLA
jgi:general secretion pathway protein G